MNLRRDNLDEVMELSGDADVLATALVADLEPIEPTVGLRDRLLATTRGPGRLYRFAAKIAAMIDVSVDKAKELLDRVAKAELWERDLVPGLDALWVEGGPAAAQCIRGFARLQAGASFPDHEHLGPETTLVLEGTMIDSLGTTVRPGETYSMEPGSLHNYRAASGGTDLLFFVVVSQGISIGPGVVMKHRDNTSET